MPRVWLYRWCHETVRETEEDYVIINDDTGETAHATCYDDHHVTPEQEAKAALYNETQAQVDRYEADLEARKTSRKAFEETLIHQQNWRDEKSVEFPDDGRNAISAAGIEAFRRWFTKLPDDDPRVRRLLRALQPLYADSNGNTSMSPLVEDLIGRSGSTTTPRSRSRRFSTGSPSRSRTNNQEQLSESHTTRSMDRAGSTAWILECGGAYRARPGRRESSRRRMVAGVGRVGRARATR